MAWKRNGQVAWKREGSADMEKKQSGNLGKRRKSGLERDEVLTWIFELGIRKDST